MMWELRRYLKPYVKFMILAPLFMMMEVFFDLLQPTLAAHIVDNGIVSRNFSVIEQTGFLMLGVALLGLATGVLCNFFASRASQNFGADIREALFTKVQTFSFENVDAFKSGSLMTRMTSDVVQVQNLVQMGLQGLIRSPSLLVGSVVMALIINRQLGLILLGTLIVLIAVVALLIRFSTPIFSAVQGKLDSVNTRIQENLAGIRVVKAFVRTGYETGRFREVNGDYTRVSIRAARFIALNSPIVTLIMNACLVTVLLYGGNQVSFGSVKAGDLVAFVNYVVQVLSSLLMVSSLLMNVSQAKVSADRIQEVLAAQPHIRDAEAKGGLSLPGRKVKLENVSFSYNGSSDPKDLVLRDINIEAERGETVAIIGATGSGKTTLVQLIPRLYDVTSGSIQLDGQDIRELPLLELRRRIGMILQESFLFTGTIRDNIVFGKPGAEQAEVEAAARIAQAHDFISRLPEGYDTKLGQKGVNLSGGQKQRLSIARALLVKPPVLIMDDSMSALDARTERQLRDALKDITAEAVTFLIAQKISSVTEADTIIVLDDGEIAGSGSHEELLQNCKVYQEIYRSQFGSEEVPYVSEPAVQSV